MSVDSLRSVELSSVLLVALLSVNLRDDEPPPSTSFATVSTLSSSAVVMDLSPVRTG
jgi:hypothetical protein